MILIVLGTLNPITIHPPNLEKNSFPAKTLFFLPRFQYFVSGQRQPRSHSQPLAAIRSHWSHQKIPSEWPQVAKSGRFKFQASEWLKVALLVFAVAPKRTFGNMNEHK